MDLTPQTRRKFTFTKLTVVGMNKSILYLPAHQFLTISTQRTIQSFLFLPDYTRPEFAPLSHLGKQKSFIAHSAMQAGLTL